MEIKTGDLYSKSFYISEEMINGFATYTGDKNPVHLDEEFAKNSIFKARIAHGFLIGSLISSVLGNDYPGNGTIYLSQSMKFLKPVFIGDTISVNITLLEITEKLWLQLRTECFNQYEKLVLTGEATVIPPKNCVLIK
jgi:3-hydroxybutyryl-CoA dehydratase